MGHNWKQDPASGSLTYASENSLCWYQSILTTRVVQDDGKRQMWLFLCQSSSFISRLTCSSSDEYESKYPQESNVLDETTCLCKKLNQGSMCNDVYDVSYLEAE